MLRQDILTRLSERNARPDCDSFEIIELLNPIPLSKFQTFHNYQTKVKWSPSDNPEAFQLQVEDYHLVVHILNNTREIKVGAAQEEKETILVDDTIKEKKKEKKKDWFVIAWNKMEQGSFPY